MQERPASSDLCGPGGAHADGQRHEALQTDWLGRTPLHERRAWVTWRPPKTDKDMVASTARVRCGGSQGDTTSGTGYSSPMRRRRSPPDTAPVRPACRKPTGGGSGRATLSAERSSTAGLAGSLTRRMMDGHGLRRLREQWRRRDYAPSRAGRRDGFDPDEQHRPQHDGLARTHPPASLIELMKEAMLQVEPLRGLNAATAEIADFARAHLENILEDLNTLPPVVAWRARQRP